MDLYDVYIWPIDDSSHVTLIAKAFPLDEAQEVCDKYMATNIYEAHMVRSETISLTI